MTQPNEVLRYAVEKALEAAFVLLPQNRESRNQCRSYINAIVAHGPAAGIGVASKDHVVVVHKSGHCKIESKADAYYSANDPDWLVNIDAAHFGPQPVQTAGLTQEQREAVAAMPGWRKIETAPEDTAVLIYGFGYEIAHFNTAIGAWVACWDHRRIPTPTHWQPLPQPPESSDE